VESRTKGLFDNRCVVLGRVGRISAGGYLLALCQ
jgi:hypothetical protein